MFLMPIIFQDQVIKPFILRVNY